MANTTALIDFEFWFVILQILKCLMLRENMLFLLKGWFQVSQILESAFVLTLETTDFG